MSKDVIDLITKEQEIERQYASQIQENRFRPVRCTEATLENVAHINGSLYFTTDTQKIFMDTADGMIQMCEGKGFYYGIKEIKYDNSGVAPNPNVVFSLNEIEGEKLPEIDDLILNIDGCFYRVKEILDDNNVFTNRLTLQGSGGGSVGPDISSSFQLYVNNKNKNLEFSSKADSALLTIFGKDESDPTNKIISLEVSYDDKLNQIIPELCEYNLNINMDTPYSIDIAKIIPSLSTEKDSYEIFVHATDSFYVTRYVTFSVKIIDLTLTAIEAPILNIVNDEYSYSCNIGGSNLPNRKLIFTLHNTDGVQLGNPLSVIELSPNATNNSTKLIFDNISHGEYELRVIIEYMISGKSVFSNILTHKVLNYKTNSPLFTAHLPQKTEQYADIPVNYMLVNGDDKSKYTVDFILDGNSETPLTSQEIIAGELNTYNLNFERKGQYSLVLFIKELNISYSTTLIISEYTGYLPVINTDDSTLDLYLTAKGRTNMSADKDRWPDFKKPYNQGELKNFYYRSINGWLNDGDTPYLKVSQGATVEFDSYSPYDTKIRENGLTIELDFKIYGIQDYREEARLIECISYQNNKEIWTGFAITGNSFYYYNYSSKNNNNGNEEDKSKLSSLNLVPDQRIRLTFVIEGSKSHPSNPLCLTYVNGILSQAVTYGENQDFSNDAIRGILKINSNYGSIDIYNIRIYSKNLDTATILNNYQASLTPRELREKSYYDNAILDKTNSQISLSKIESKEYKLNIPYVKLIGSRQVNEDTWEMSAANKIALPQTKSDYKAIDMEVIYPKAEDNPYFKDYSNFKITTTFDDLSKNVISGIGNIIQKGARMYVQGTSSIYYPVKNLRVECKGYDITVNPKYDPVNLICFKADYMESSGSHNTGAGNYIDEIYKGINLKTPGQEHFGDKTITCIKGHPCVIFWNPGIDENGNELDLNNPDNYQYIGKYNLNFDKATPEPFGFNHDDSDFGYEYDENGEKKNSIYCFEFLDNNVSVCNFLSDDISNKNSELITETQRYNDTWYGTRDIKKSSGKIEKGAGWRVGFESRYPEDKEGKNDADALYPFASWINELYYLYKQELADGKNPNEINETIEYVRSSGDFNSGQVYYYLNEDNGEYEIIHLEPETYEKNIYFIKEIISSKFAMDSLNRFKNEYQRFLNHDFLIFYYVITEILLMVDSRVKNMMIATWGKEERKYIDKDGNEQTSNEYIWYPIFYDMDTMLGLTNEGYKAFKYYEEDTGNPSYPYNGETALWKFVQYTLKEEIAKTYNSIDEKNLSAASALIKNFNDNQALMANEIFYNEDAEYKYIVPFREGFFNQFEDEKDRQNRLYAAQGTRAMEREYFIKNRIKYLNGKYLTTTYQQNDVISFRLTCPQNSGGENSQIDATVEHVPPSGDFEFTAGQIGYAGVQIGQNTVPISARFEENETKTLSTNIASAGGTETYIQGFSNLIDIGDLSTKYPRAIQFGTDNVLQKLYLGNHNKYYYNENWGKDNSELIVKELKYLKYFNFENCSEYTKSISLKECQQLETFLATGTRISDVSLPVNGVLKELRLPTSIKDLKIDSHVLLTDDGFTYGYFEYDNDSDTEGHYVNDYSGLNRAKIINTPINTYNLVKQATWNFRENDGEGTNVSTFSHYCFTNVNWEITDLNDLIFDENKRLIGIKVLEVLKPEVINGKQNPKWLGCKPYEQGASAAESLTGNLLININDNEHIINEFDVYELYNDIYPNLNIEYKGFANIEKACRINFYSTENLALTPHYSVLSSGGLNLELLTSADGPVGYAITTPIKPNTADTVYAFNNTWVVARSDDNSLVGTKYNIEDFDIIIPKVNMDLVAQYDSNPRYYRVKLYDYDGKTLIFDVEKDTDLNGLTYKADIGNSLDDYWQLTYNYRQYDSKSKEHYRYTFKGWQSRHDYDKKLTQPTWPSLKGVLIEEDFIAYAFYVEEDATKVATNQEYFSLNEEKSYSVEDAKYSGYALKLLPKYKDVLQGKITIPSFYTINNIKYPVSFIGDFNDAGKITDVYFLNDSQLIGLQSNCFKMTKENQLKNVYLPKNETFKFLGDNAFTNCVYLENIDIEKTGILNDNITYIGQYCFGWTDIGGVEISAQPMRVHMQKLPSGLKYLKSGAFNSFIGTSGNVNITISELPSSLTKLEPWTFGNCPNVNITEFGSNTLGQGLTTIKGAALYKAGSGVETVNIYKSVTHLGTIVGLESYGAFSGYGDNTLKIMNFYKPYEDYRSEQTQEPLSESVIGSIGINTEETTTGVIL